MEAFEADFKALTGHPPFRWQQRLYDDFTAETIETLPTAIDLPTGLGKTSVIAIWLLARAKNQKLPRRLAYVVDRRVVVDQATAEAEKLRKALKDDPALASLALALGLDAKLGLPISTLRGRHADNRLWLENPARPAIIVGTIDMIGSRLLFEGYGVSRRMRPYQAGFLGADTLVVLDEAHLCPPFQALLAAIATDEALTPKGERRRTIVPKFRLLPLSATGGDGGDRPFRLETADADESAQPMVHKRFTARKRLIMKEASDEADLVSKLAHGADDLGKDGSRVIIFCNRRETAQKVEGELRKLTKSAPIEFIVGKRRVREREKLVEWLGQHGFTPAEGSALSCASRETPAFIVATSAGEVGVDLDADHMVCDLVAFERMVQRLGRVNRRGGDGREAKIDVFCVPPRAPKPAKTDSNDEKKNADKDEKEKEYAAALTVFQARKAALAALPLGQDDRYDASPKAFVELKAVYPSLAAKATTPEPLRPALDRAVVDAWSLTSLREHPGRPEPGPWLRGWVDDEKPQTQVIWRQWLPWRNGSDRPTVKEEIESFFDAAPPHASEMLEAAVWEVAEVLLARAAGFVSQQQAAADEGEEPQSTEDGVIILNPAREFRRAVSAKDLASLSDKARKRDRDDFEREIAMAIVVVSAPLGGLDEQGLLNADCAEAPSCLDGDWSDDEVERIGVRVRGPGIALDGESGWREEYRFPLTLGDDAEPECIAVDVLRRAGAAQLGDLGISKRAQSLAEHSAWAADEAARLATALGLDGDYTAMLIAAAQAHDHGKARDLWQDAMRAPRDGGRPYAKTTRSGDPSRLKIGEWTYRHEFGSLRDVEGDPALETLPEALRDLALHLIAAHHGFARPIIAPVDPLSPTSKNAARAQEVALRFARLQRDWGPWGLAWWEAVLRAADQRASRRLNDEGNG